jgi:hypothetical protein
VGSPKHSRIRINRIEFIFYIKTNAKKSMLNKISKFQIKTKLVLLIFLFVPGVNRAQHSP